MPTTKRLSSQWQTWSLQFAEAAILLLPSWLTISLRNTPKNQAKISPTVYLDGLRGLFSFLVFVRHFLLPWEKDLDTGYHPNGNTSVFKLPFVRLFYSGPTVPIFFLISGFVISYKPLGQIHKGDYNSLIRSLMPSIFRRALRLFLPPITTTFFVALAVYFGFYDSSYDKMPATVPRHPERFNSLVVQLFDWMRFVLVDLTHPWSWKSPKSEYDSHLWTIPIQFRASMIVFLTLIGLARAKSRVRSIIIFALCLYSLQQHRWEVTLFFSGVLLAERSLTRLQTQPLSTIPLQECVKVISDLPIERKIFWRVIFLTGLYLGSYPRASDAGRATLGCFWMSKLVADYRYWHALGAIFLVWAVGSDVWLQRLFVSGLMRYMGNISFSLYLIHGPVLHLFGYSLVPAFHHLTGRDTALQYQLGVLFALLFLTPVILWIADIFWRLIEKRCVTFVLMIEAYCLDVQ